MNGPVAFGRPCRVLWLLALWFPGLLPGLVLAEDATTGSDPAPVAQPQDPSLDLFRTLELRGHQSLLEIRATPGTALAPFTTDGCSGGMSAGWELIAEEFPALAERTYETPPWEACCVTHDRAYHDAGAGAGQDPDLGLGATPTAEDSYAARLTADGVLRTCVEATGQARLQESMERFGLRDDQVRQIYALVAQAMFTSVRLGGGPCTRLPWRWGYGYPQC